MLIKAATLTNINVQKVLQVLQKFKKVELDLVTTILY